MADLHQAAEKPALAGLQNRRNIYTPQFGVNAGRR